MFAKILSRLNSGDTRSVIVKKNIIGSLIIKGLSIIIQLMLVPLTINYVSSEIYGIWLTLSSVILWLNFFDVGFTLGLKNRLTTAIALNQLDRAKSLVSTTYFMMVVIFVPICMLMIFLVPEIRWDKLLNISSSYSNDVVKAMQVLCCCFCLQMIVNVMTSVVAAYQKVALSNLFPVLGNILSIFAILYLREFEEPSLLKLSVAIAIMPILVIGLISIYLYNTKFTKVAPSPKYINLEYSKDIFGLGIKFFIIQLQTVVMFQATNLLISNISGPTYVTTYNIAYKYLNVAMMIYTILLNPLWPAFTDAYAKSDYKWMNSIYKKMKHIYMVSVLVMALMILVSTFVYKLWIGNNAEIPFIMTVIVGFYMMINTWDALQVQLINGIGKVKLQSYVTLIGLLFHLPLSFLLGKYIGGYGVLVSMIVITIIYSFVFTIQINKILKKKSFGIWDK